MPYRAPVDEFRFLFDHVVDLHQLAGTERFEDLDAEVADAILTGAARVSDEVLAPLQRRGDLEPARMENGVLRSTPGFAEGFAALRDGGWVAIAAPVEHGGMGLPQTLASAVNDMMSGACLALHLNPLLTQGQIDALEHHADPALQALYLPRLIAGEWSGTMNLTEPQAGSDVGALTTRAEPRGDGTYAITGQKIFISWGDCDFVGNVCHLVLARLPDGAPGTKGISLFLVPKFLPDENGAPGEANSLRVVSLEHKLGLHGSPTAVMQYDGATGWLVGAPHDGMRAMFTMMNNARLAVGIQGIGVAEAAYQQALAYAMERRQGRTPVGKGQGAIIEHADVRRMLAVMRGEIFAARAIALACGVAIDMARATGDADWQARAAFLTPIAKAYGTDTGVSVASQGVQVHGGMGFIEETGAAQYLRDVRVTTIYEGTNGIQAMDLVARKMADEGEAAYRLLEEIETGAEAARGTFPEMANALWSAAETLRETTEALVVAPVQDRFAGAVAYLRAFALILGGHYHLRAAMAERGQTGEEGARVRLARVFMRRILPEHAGLLQQMAAGADVLYALTPEDLGV